MKYIQRLGAVTERARFLSLSSTLLVSSDYHTEEWSLAGQRLTEWVGGRTLHTDIGILSTTTSGPILGPGEHRLSLYGGYGSVHGAYTLTATGKGALIRRLHDLAPLARIDADGCDNCIASPDGRHLAALDYYHVELISLTDRTVRRLIPATSPQVAFSPDGKRLAVVSPDGLVVVQVDSDEPIPIPPMQFDYDCQVIFLDGERVVVSDQGTLWLWFGGGWQSYRPPGATDAWRPRRPSTMAVHNELLAALDPEGAVHLWSVPGAKDACPAPLVLPGTDRLEGAVVCLTGTFTHIGKREATVRIEALGGRVARSPVKALTHLVYGQPKYSGPIKETGADRKVKARIAAGAAIERWPESRLISALTPDSTEAARQLRACPEPLIAWMNTLAAQKIADRRYLHLVDQDLSGLDLRTVPLEEASLHGADLRGADLRGARLYRLKAPGADLRGAQLQGASLGQSNLRGADLRGAQLSGTTLDYVLLTGAKLAGAQTDGLTLRWCRLQGCDLSALDLSKVNETENFWDETTRWPPGYTPSPSR